MRHGARGWWMLLCLSFGAVPYAWSQTDEIQVYDAEIVEQGKFNLTWHNNFTPSGRTEPDFPGGVVPDHALNGVPEWAYGVRDWFELGAYVPIYTLTSNGSLLFEGVKLRTLFVVPHAAERKFFYGVNFEYSYNQPRWDTHEFSGEIRPIVGVHLGHVDLILNPIFDTEYNGVRNLDFAPEARVAYNFSEHFAVALEQYSDFGPVKGLVPPSEQDQTLFLTFDLNSGGDGIEFGVGHGFTDAGDNVVIKLMWIHDF
jgi:hypothetical protein